MIRPVRLHPEAETEFADAIHWYQSKRFDLAVDFARAVEEGITAIRGHPERQPTVHADIRRLIIRRFPYGIFYSVRPTELKVLAVYHLSRDPKGWKSRQ
jgi:plasmid stabilization system protein ParE